MAKLNAALKGLDQARADLKNLKRTVAGRIARKAVTAASKPVTKTTKQVIKAAHKESGLLWKSYGQVVKTTKKGETLAIMGPRRGFAQTFKLKVKPPGLFRTYLGLRFKFRKPLSKATYEQFRRASKYAHLVVKDEMLDTFNANQTQMVNTVNRVVAEELGKLGTKR